MMRSGLAVLVAVCIALAPVPVDARPSKRERQRAEQLATSAIQAYQKRNYVAAANLFLKAYRLTRHPVQLRNAAKATEEGGALERAKSLWSRFVEHDDINDDERREGRAHIALIEERQRREEASQLARDARAAAARAEEQAIAAKKAAEVAAVAARPPQAEPSPPYAAYVGIGVGALMMAAGGVVFLLASRDTSRLDQRIAEVDDRGLIVGITSREVEAEVGAINDQRLVAGLLGGTGTILILGGLLWLALDDAPRAIEPNVQVSASGASVGLVGRF